MFWLADPSLVQFSSSVHVSCRRVKTCENTNWATCSGVLLTRALIYSWSGCYVETGRGLEDNKSLSSTNRQLSSQSHPASPGPLSPESWAPLEDKWETRPVLREGNRCPFVQWWGAHVLRGPGVLFSLVKATKYFMCATPEIKNTFLVIFVQTFKGKGSFLKMKIH